MWGLESVIIVLIRSESTDPAQHTNITIVVSIGETGSAHCYSDPVHTSVHVQDSIAIRVLLKAACLSYYRQYSNNSNCIILSVRLVELE